MARLSSSEKEDMSFWIYDDGKICYCKKCARCSHKCKQSFRCIEVICPKYLRR
ncbi:hypothetical protein [Clostridium sp.]|uniref:hypothetical protein n=1 Tax=Clostridium sp. TaxID=1506 RepID=UPI001A595FA6|nr:hypothetical protein [Clostridium sp.]MBK5242056.1 hypothetical protein [Clostridium sp.]